MSRALALLEFSSVASGILTVDTMLKKSPVALLQCGSVHPGRYLALVGGTVASTEEAHAAGVECAARRSALVDDVFLPDPHPLLSAALAGGRSEPVGEAVAVCDLDRSPSLLRVVDAALKAVPVGLVEVRLADDLGGRAVAVFDGTLTDLQEVLDLVGHRSAPATVLDATILPRIDETLRAVLAEGTEFRACAVHEPEGAETIAAEE